MIFSHGKLAFLEGVGGGEMMWVLLIALLLFGGDKLPGLAKGMGKAIREFKKAAGDVENELKRAIEEVPDTSTPQPPTAFPPPNTTPASAPETYPPSATTADPDGAYPYMSEPDLPIGTTTAPAPAAPPPSEPAPTPPGDQPPTPPAPPALPSPYEHLSDL